MELVMTHQAQSLELPIDLGELTERVAEATRSCYDHVGVVLRDTRMPGNGTWSFQGEEGRLSQHALRQLCARLTLPQGGTVPASYLVRCPESLAAENLNHWLAHSHRNGQHVLVRVGVRRNSCFPTVRAILSNRYAPVDHQPLLEALRDLVPRHHLSVAAWSLDDELLVLRLLVNADHPASLEDPLRVGLHVSNSEIGLGRISILALVTRLVCSNGMVVKVADLGGLHRRHVGRIGEDLHSLIQEALPRVLEEADQAAQRFVRLREQPAPQPVATFVARTVREADLPEATVPQILAALEGESLYDLLNALTRVAQRFDVVERVRIETFTSRFLRDGALWN